MSGCTLVGATTGAIVARGRKDASVPAHVAVGATAGLAVDVVVVLAAASSMSGNPLLILLLLLAAGG